MEFKVKVTDGEVYINDEFISQLCWTPEAIGAAITVWLQDNNNDKS